MKDLAWDTLKVWERDAASALVDEFAARRSPLACARSAAYIIA